LEDRERIKGGGGGVRVSCGETWTETRGAQGKKAKGDSRKSRVNLKENQETWEIESIHLGNGGTVHQSRERAWEEVASRLAQKNA